MVESLVDVVEEKIDVGSLPQEHPSIRGFIYRTSDRLKFDDAIHEFKNYTRLYNEGNVAPRLEIFESLSRNNPSDQHLVGDIGRNNQVKPHAYNGGFPNSLISTQRAQSVFPDSPQDVIATNSKGAGFTNDSRVDIGIENNNLPSFLGPQPIVTQTPGAGTISAAHQRVVPAELAQTKILYSAAPANRLSEADVWSVQNREQVVPIEPISQQLQAA
ncbi:unnamed protein product [Sphagnum balticum]